MTTPSDPVEAAIEGNKGDDPSLRESPRRVQRKRTKGWKMPPNTVYVGRPTRWRNPYRVGTCLIGDAESAVMAFRANLPLGDAWLSPLRGKNLACWCSLDQPCHADVLLEIANAEPPGNRKDGSSPKETP
jgi:hypothetical protein